MWIIKCEQSAMSCGILKKYLTPSVNINTAAAQWLSPCGGGVVVWCAGLLIPGSIPLFWLE